VNEILIWARCSEVGQPAQMTALDARLRADGDPFRVVATGPEDHPVNGREIGTQWPDLALVLWVGGALHPATLRHCQIHDIPVLIVSPDADTIASLPGRWLPGRKRAMIDPVTHVFAQGKDTIAAFVRAGLDPARATLTETLEEVVTIPPFDADEMRHLTGLTGTRPLWLAAMIDAADVPPLIAAQRQAARRSHRLMLIACPAEGIDDAAIGQAFAEAGLVTVLRSEGKEPEDGTQVYVADGPSEIGLWLRVAGINYLGGSFGPAARLDPFVAASLGSVMIHGPRGGPYQNRLDKLQAAQATHPVSLPSSIGPAVETLLSVGDAAERATAGWDVVSRGAELTNALIEQITRLTDGRR